MKKLFGLVLALLCSANLFATDLFLVGDATPVGWNIGGASRTTQMTEISENVFVWIGKLTTGGEGFKVSDNVNAWGDWHPSSSYSGKIDTTPDIMRNGNPDTKWQVSADGIYQVTIDWSTKAISCQAYEPTAIPQVDGVYQIPNATVLTLWAMYVGHGVIAQDAKAALTADIDLTNAAFKFFAIGLSSNYPYKGEFNGQGHKITINLEDLRERTGLFAYVNCATIRNLHVSGNISSGYRNCLGGLGGRSDGDGTLIENVYVDTDIEFFGTNSDATVGGFFANMEGVVTFRNCVFAGSINTGTSDGNGCFVGWAGGGDKMRLENCLALPTSYTKNGNSADYARNNPTVVNCYAPASTDTRLASGELCYLLNGSVSGGTNWIQNLATAAFPIPNNSDVSHATPNIVYANGELKCDGSIAEGGEVSFSNNNTSEIPAHDYVNGWCSVCGQIYEDHLTPVDGAYALSTMDDLNWFSGMVAVGHQDINAVVQNDIDQPSGYIFTPIGTETKPFTGQFNGQNHIITLGLENAAYKRQGLFGTLSGDAAISNVIVSGTIDANEYAGGIAGAVQNAGTVTFTCCGNEADVTVVAANAGGILGVNFSGKVVLKNCYNVGTITGDRESAGISGWLGSNAEVENTYNAGAVYGVDGEKTFARWSSGTYKNCYNVLDANSVSGRTDSYSMSKVMSGELCVALGDGFTQDLGNDYYPTFGHAKVAEMAISELEYATFIAPFNITSFPAAVEPFYAVAHTNYVELQATTQVAQGEAVVLRADEGKYYANGTESAVAASATNELIPATSPVTADGSQYILIGNPGSMAFYKATPGSTIPAGKGYLQISSSAKAVYAIGSEVTGINEVADTEMTHNYYNLAGQQIAAPQKGVNIVAGKKFMVK